MTPFWTAFYITIGVCSAMLVGLVVFILLIIIAGRWLLDSEDRLYAIEKEVRK